MIVDLVKDFADVLDAMPTGHPRYRILKLLDEAIRRDVHFIDRHPTTLFQCLWNTCWSCDCPEAAGRYFEPEGGWSEPRPWVTDGAKLCDLLEAWREAKEERTTGWNWVRSLRPPAVPPRRRTAGGLPRPWTHASQKWLCTSVRFTTACIADKRSRAEKNVDFSTEELGLRRSAYGSLPSKNRMPHES